MKFYCFFHIFYFDRKSEPPSTILSKWDSINTNRKHLTNFDADGNTSAALSSTVSDVPWVQPKARSRRIL
jgi:hypothetical protein